MANDVGGVAADKLRTFIERLERLAEEKKGISDDEKDVKAEAKGEGFDLKAISIILKLRKKSPEERSEEESVLAVYLAALGMD
jgi:uncharacterized protein (UPF0335 family)